MSVADARITWHADPWVAAVAVYRTHKAEVWINDDDSASWCIFPIGAAGTFPATRATSFEAAKTAAEDALRATSAQAQEG